MALYVEGAMVEDSIDIITEEISVAKPPKIKCRVAKEVKGQDYYAWKCWVRHASEEQIAVENVVEEEGILWSHFLRIKSR